MQTALSFGEENYCTQHDFTAFIDGGRRINLQEATLKPQTTFTIMNSRKENYFVLMNLAVLHMRCSRWNIAISLVDVKMNFVTEFEVCVLFVPGSE